MSEVKCNREIQAHSQRPFGTHFQPGHARCHGQGRDQRIQVGELRWFRNTVEKSVGRSHVEEPKRPKSKGAIPVIAQLRILLDQHWERCGRPGAGFIFSNELGNSMNLEALAVDVSLVFGFNDLHSDDTPLCGTKYPWSAPIVQPFVQPAAHSGLQFADVFAHTDAVSSRSREGVNTVALLAHHIQVRGTIGDKSG